jgi:hypothetical protein
MLLALLACAGARAQQANEDEVAAVTVIYRCLIEGLPADWGKAHVLVTLPEPGAMEGNVRYMASPESAPDKIDPFAPCDPAVPARVMIKLRETLTPEKQRWTGAQLELVRATGSFRITYDYSTPEPKPKPKPKPK